MVKRNVRVMLAGTALLVFVAACSQRTPTAANSCDQFGVGCSQEELQDQLTLIRNGFAQVTASGAEESYDDIENPALLQCEQQSYTGRAKVIGPGGGVLNFGPHRINFPPGAVSNNVVVSGELQLANHVLVELSPPGLQMSAPAILELAYGFCQSGATGLEVAYVDDNLRVISYPDAPSGGSPSGEVWAELWHFSKYAVAY